MQVTLLLNTKALRFLIVLTAGFVLCVTIIGTTGIAHAAGRVSNLTIPLKYTSPSSVSFAVAGGTITGMITPIASSQMYRKPGAYFFNIDQSLLPINLRYFVVNGQSVNGTYLFSYKLTANRETTLDSVELATDTQLHTQLIAVGSPTNTLAHPPIDKGQSATSSRGEVNLALNGGKSGSFRTDWWDFIGIHVNEVSDNISFTYDGRHVNSYNYSDYRWWLSDDGWFEASHSLGASVTNNNGVLVWTDDLMQNNPFCAGHPTYVIYNDNVVQGNPDGSVSGYVNTWSMGPCGDFLHHTSQLNG